MLRGIVSFSSGVVCCAVILAALAVTRSDAATTCTVGDVTWGTSGTQPTNSSYNCHGRSTQTNLNSNPNDTSILNTAQFTGYANGQFFDPNYDPNGTVDYSGVTTTGLFGVNNWQFLSKVDTISGGAVSSGYIQGVNAAQSGSFSIVDNSNYLSSAFSYLMVILKAGSANGSSGGGSAAYLIDVSAAAVGWTTLNVLSGKDLSNVALYGIPAAVPVPAGMGLLIAAVAGFGVAARRKRRAMAA